MELVSFYSYQYWVGFYDVFVNNFTVCFNVENFNIITGKSTKYLSIISSFSISVIYLIVLTLSVNNGFIIFQNLLLLEIQEGSKLL